MGGVAAGGLGLELGHHNMERMLRSPDQRHFNPPMVCE